jgi:hypothetical protein
MRWSIRLGSSKPAVLQQTEKTIWKAILDIVNQPGDYLTILNDLASAFPSTYIQELERQSEAVTGWFDIDLQNSTNPTIPRPLEGTPSGTSALSQSSLPFQSDKEADSDSQPTTIPHVTQPGTSGDSLPSQASQSNEGANSDLLASHVTRSGTSAVTAPSQASQSDEEANSNLKRSTVPHVTEPATSAVSSPSRASHSNDEANNDAGRRDQQMEKSNEIAREKDRVSGDGGTRDKEDNNRDAGVDSMDVDDTIGNEDKDAGGGDQDGEIGGMQTANDDEADRDAGGIGGKGKSNEMVIDAGEKDLVSRDGGTRDKEDNNGHAAGVDNTGVDDTIGKARLRSGPPRNSYPIEHSKSLSSSASKRRRNRHSASAGQATSSQKRGILDEALKILVVCILRVFFPTFIQHDFQGKPQSATLEDSEAEEVHFGECMTAYDISAYIHPTFKHMFTIPGPLISF